jgi:leader peptidase (prepilin peptidase)/N-methyltransferase
VATFNPATGLLALSNEPPLWLSVLGGVLLGYLVGGGVVWGTRIAGSLGFGKEAMGLGDVHLMAAVGACLGWIDAVLAFFLAAFVGVAWAVLGVVAGGKVKRSMPYGPFLAVATLLVLFCKPLIERGLTRLLHAEVPINLP